MAAVHIEWCRLFSPGSVSMGFRRPDMQTVARVTCSQAVENP